MNPDVTVRRADRDDFEGWFTLFEEVAAEGRWIGSELPLDRDRRRAGFDKMTSGTGEHGVIFLAESGREQIGQLGVHPEQGRMDLGMLVRDGYRGRGVGSILMQSAVEWATANGAHKLTLQLWPHNRAAQALYEKFGFVVEGRLSRHYRRISGELWDAVMMGLVLDQKSPGSPHEANSGV